MDVGCRALVLTAMLALPGCWEPPERQSGARLTRDLRVGPLECVLSIEIGPEPDLRLDSPYLEGGVPIDYATNPSLQAESDFRGNLNRFESLGERLARGITAYSEGRFAQAKELLASVRDAATEREDAERTQAIYWLFYVERDSPAVEYAPLEEAVNPASPP